MRRELFCLRAAGGDIRVVYRCHRGIWGAQSVAGLHRGIKDRGGEFAGGRIAGVDGIARR